MFNLFNGAMDISNMNATPSPASFTGMISSPSMAPQVVSGITMWEGASLPPVIRRGDCVELMHLAPSADLLYNGEMIEWQLIKNLCDEDKKTVTKPTRPNFVAVISEAVTWMQKSSGQYITCLALTVQGTEEFRLPKGKTLREPAKPGQYETCLSAWGIRAVVSVDAPVSASVLTVYIEPTDATEHAVPLESRSNVQYIS